MQDAAVSLCVQDSMFGVWDPENPENNRRQEVADTDLTLTITDFDAFFEALRSAVKADGSGYILGWVNRCEAEGTVFVCITGTDPRKLNATPEEALPRFAELVKKVAA